MRRLLLTVACFLAFTTSTLARVDIPFKLWKPNKHPGYCGWVSCKVLLLYHGWTDVAKDIINDETRFGGFDRVPPGGCDPYKLKRRFKSYIKKYGLKYKQQMDGPKDEKHIRFVRDAIRKGYGAVVSVDKGNHAVTLIDFTEDKRDFKRHGKSYKDYAVEWIDSNDVLDYRRLLQAYKTHKGRKEPKRPTTHITSLRNWKQDWDGWAVVIYPKNEPPTPKEDTHPSFPGIPNNIEDGGVDRPIAPVPPIAPLLIRPGTKFPRPTVMQPLIVPLRPTYKPNQVRTN